MTDHEQAMGRLRRRLALALLLKHALAFFTVWAFLWGTAVLVLRLTAGTSPLVLLWGLAAVPVLGGLAVVPARRRQPSPTAVRALLDRASGCGGLLLAAAEHDLGRWERMLPPPAGLRVRWHGARACTLFAAAMVFLATALLFPERLATLGASRGLEIGNEVARLLGQIDLLKQAAVLEPERADSLKENLAKLKKNASGESPAKTLEALDHVQNTVSKAAKEAGEAAVGKTENLAKAEALAEALAKAGADVDPKVKAEALAELAALAQKAAADSKLVEKHLDAKALKDLKAGKLSPGQMKKLAQALRGGRQDLTRLLEKLSAARLIDPELRKACDKAGLCDAEGLAKLLKEGAGKMAVGEMLAKCKGKVEGERPGRGGVTEGPGAAALTWGDKSSEEGVKFKEEALPPAAVKALKESRLAGLGKEAPSTEKTDPSVPGALGQAAAGGGSANTAVILPRHRATIQRYFERPARKSGKTEGE
jgi:hypothetical protein